MKPDLRLGDLVEPRTGAALRLESGRLVSEQSGREFLVHADWVDFIPERDREGPQLVTALMHLPSVSAAYEEVVRPSVDRLRIGQRVDWRQEMAWAVEVLQAHRGVVADIACGSGAVGVRAARGDRFERLYCVDRSEPLLAQCVRRSEMARLGCPVVLLRADARYLPLADAILDAAHVRFGASLWRGAQQLMAEWARGVQELAGLRENSACSIQGRFRVAVRRSVRNDAANAVIAGLRGAPDSKMSLVNLTIDPAAAVTGPGANPTCPWKLP